VVDSRSAAARTLVVGGGTTASQLLVAEGAAATMAMATDISLLASNGRSLFSHRVPKPLTSFLTFRWCCFGGLLRLRTWPGRIDVRQLLQTTTTLVGVVSPLEALSWALGHVLLRPSLCPLVRHVRPPLPLPRSITAKRSMKCHQGKNLCLFISVDALVIVCGRRVMLSLLLWRQMRLNSCHL
jgi:hypothetical protein